MKRKPFEPNRATHWTNHTQYLGDMGILEYLSKFTGGQTRAWVSDGEIVIDFGSATRVNSEHPVLERNQESQGGFSFQKGRFKLYNGAETYEVDEDWVSHYEWAIKKGCITVETVDGVLIATDSRTSSGFSLIPNATQKVNL